MVSQKLSSLSSLFVRRPLPTLYRIGKGRRDKKFLT